MTEIPEPHPYGDFPTVEDLIKAVEVRQNKNKNPYGHAIIYPVDEKGFIVDRIGARVSFSGDITVRAHSEWI